MFDRNDKELSERRDQEEERIRRQGIKESMSEHNDENEDRKAKLQRITEESKWSTQGLKPNTNRKKIGLVCLIAGLIGYLVLQYVIKGGG